jgi:hypothetical protein
MKKLAPFIPIVGIFLTGYFMIGEGEDTGIEDYGKIFWSSALVQMASILFVILFFDPKC